MTTDRPIWLMDVDGPLNIFHNRMPIGLQSFHAGNGFQITFDPTILNRLATLHAEGRVELQWLTAWEHLADVHLAEKLGLPRGLTIAGQSAVDRAPHLWWKHNAVSRLYDAGHRLIWTDDDITLIEADALAWLKEQDPSRIVWDSPDETVGITHEFIDRVEAWL